ncbi:hypothetical protein HOLleu_27627 [Holothuria leucospilota]|uniref:Retrovirus-related Pol polyprotein from transposon TNT 1-94-like beta-barrel domain-containing protein n=1 Tax=Holothuria leucospilota TaxID=206669 RepID=A0A9Q1H2G7_HOLLE|nr:hypothetical protein HOLleu_27627 [Holothuria leucospilota]
MVDCGATSHILTDVSKFIKFDSSFNPDNHFMELEDGTRRNNVAQKRGDAVVTLQDVKGNCIKATLKGVLYIPSYPQDIFSVKAAISDGAKVNFQQGCNRLVHKDGTIFSIQERGRLYYLNTVTEHNTDEGK